MDTTPNGKDPVMAKLEELAAQLENLTDTVNDLYEYIQEIGQSDFDSLD